MSGYKTAPQSHSNGSSTISPMLLKELEYLIQSLKNNQHCFAEAASLVNSSQLRTIFEQVELKRTIFMSTILKSINRLDLSSSSYEYTVTVSWFASLPISNRSKDAFDFDILSRCIQAEEAIRQAYASTLNLKGQERVLMFLDTQKTNLDTVSQQLRTLHTELGNSDSLHS